MPTLSVSVTSALCVVSGGEGVRAVLPGSDSGPGGGRDCGGL